MNIRDLEYLCALAESCHFGKAAQICNVSQPTLSGQIRKLENQLGVSLFERTNRSVRLSRAGADILPVAKEILRKSREIEQLAEMRRDPLAGLFRLGLIPTIAPYLIPLFVGPLKNRLPSLTPVFVEAVTEDLLARLRAGDLDAAILATEEKGPGLENMALYDEPFWLAVPRGHGLTQAPKVNLTDLSCDEILLLTEGHCFRDQALSLCRSNGASAEAQENRIADTSATSLETIINLVGAGLGMTLVPALSIRGAWTTDLGVIVLPLQAPLAKRRVRLYFRAGYPREKLLAELAGCIFGALPNTIRLVD